MDLSPINSANSFIFHLASLAPSSRKMACLLFLGLPIEKSSSIYLWNNDCSCFQGLPTEDDGNSHNFFCALRLVVNNQAMDQQKLFPQSARTRCIKPVISKDESIARWNELFVFEVPRKV